MDRKISTKIESNKFDKQLRSLIRGGKHEEADKLLANLLAQSSDPLAETCLNIPPDSVQIIGWVELGKKVASISHKSVSITAVGVDLSSQSPGTDDQGWTIQAVETSYYSDRVFKFSGSSAARILRYSTPQGSLWQGHFEDIDQCLQVRGLNELNSHLSQWAPWEGQEAVVLANWFRHLRFHQAAMRGIASQSALRVPLLVGTNEVGPWIEALYTPAQIEITHPSAKTLAESERRGALKYAEYTEYEIDLLKGGRDRMMSLFRNEKSEFAVAEWHFKYHEDVHYRHSPAMQSFAFSFELSDLDFELYCEAYRQQREAYRTGARLPVAKPTSSALK